MKTLKTVLGCLMVIFLAVGMMSGQAAAAEKSRLHEVLDRGHLIVGTGSTNAPWHFTDESGNLVGFDVDMARIVAKGLFKDPNKIKFVKESSDARIPNLVTGKVDLVFHFMTITAERAQQVDFTIPYYREGISTLMLAEGGRYKSLEELQQAGSEATLSMLQNVYAEEWAHKVVPGSKVDQYDDQTLVIQAVNTRRADAAIIDISNLRWLIKQHPGRYLDIRKGWNPNSYGGAVRKGDQIWLNFVNTVLHEAMTGVEFEMYAASFKKWFAVDLEPPQIGFPVEYK